jgi:APA family basic amino acid/polyamine antiporter
MTQLKRELTTFDLTMIAIGSTIGSGIFLTPSSIAQTLQGPLLIILVWIIGGLMALSGGLTFAELGSMMPRAGGVYVFLNEAYGGMAGFLYGWAYFLVVNTGGIAALGIAFATYFGYFFPLDAAGIRLVAIVGIAIVTGVNVLGVKAGGVFSDVFTILKLTAILGLIAVGLGWGSPHLMDFRPPLFSPPGGLGSALAVAMVGVLWSFGGWQHATYTAGEAKDPKRSLPVSLIIGTITVTVVYVLTVLAYMFLLPMEKIASSPRLATDAVGTILGSAGGRFIAAAIFISTFGTAGIYTLTAPRIYYAMANDGVFFHKVARLHPRYGTPVFAIVFQSCWAALLILFWGTFENLISYVVFTDWIFFTLAAASVFVFRRRAQLTERTYRTPGYPVTPLFFVAISAWFVLNTLVEKPAQAWAGLGFLALGVPVYNFWKRQGRMRSV